jgi:hypothetical protein
MGASNFATDEDGDSALHLAIMKMFNAPLVQMPLLKTEAPHIWQVRNSLRFIIIIIIF